MEDETLLDINEVSQNTAFFAEENHEISDEYKIITKSGSGGCSVVYDAWRKADGRHVAIKVLALPDTLDPEEVKVTKQRFYREARILKSLEDEHSVACYDYGVFTGAPCVVLEFIEGMQLDEYLREYGALPFEYAVDIMCQVLRALGEAHSKGIIHRDIKPANILVIKDSDPPVVRLIDFGIASLMEGALGEMMKTKLGVVRGTPSYMAPELFTGNVAASPESDIYAIGLVILEVLTGAVVVSGASLVQIAFKQAHEPVEVPLNIPKPLADIIRKCCEKAIEDRYHTCEEVADALEAALPDAVKMRSKCEQEYLESIRQRGARITTNSFNSFPSMEVPPASSSKLPIIIASVAIIAVIALVIFLVLGNSKESSNASAQQAAAEEQAKAAQEAAKAAADAAKALQETLVNQQAAAQAQQEKETARLAAEAQAAKERAENAEREAQEAKAAQEAAAAELAAANANANKRPASQRRARQGTTTSTGVVEATRRGTDSTGKTKDTSSIPLNIF